MVTEADARRAAMNLLARREHTGQELLDKLSRRFGTDDTLAVIETVITSLGEEGLQSDARLAEVLIRSRAGRGQGPLKIRSELKIKGVDDVTIEEAFKHCNIDWEAAITVVARKRFGDMQAGNVKDRVKRNRFLQQRGFDFDQIRYLERGCYLA